MTVEPFDRAFLEWVRRETESRWATYAPRDFHAARVGGLDWRAGTRWRGGMTDAEVEGAEMQHNLRFPPDYRLFLTTLHTPDPPMVGAAYEGDRLVDRDGRAFVDWQGDPADVKRRLEWPLDGLLWSIEADNSWNPNWGPRPRTKASREAVIRKLAMSGPQLVPIAWHAYVAGPPERTGNPVLSMYGADVIVFASDLRQYLLTAFHLDPAVVAGADPEGIGGTIPFWADVIETGLPEHHGSSSPR